MTGTTQNVEQADTLVGQADMITDTIPAVIFDSVEKFYARHGYKLQGYTLITAATYDATFTR